MWGVGCGGGIALPYAGRHIGRQLQHHAMELPPVIPNLLALYQVRQYRKTLMQSQAATLLCVLLAHELDA